MIFFSFLELGHVKPHLGLRIYLGAQSGEQLTMPVRSPEIKPRCGVTTTNNGPVGPTHPPVTTAVELAQPLVTSKTHPYVGIFIYSERGRRIRSKYTHIVMRERPSSLRRDEKLSARGDFFLQEITY